MQDIEPIEVGAVLEYTGASGLRGTIVAAYKDVFTCAWCYVCDFPGGNLYFREPTRAILRLANARVVKRPRNRERDGAE